MRSVGFAAILCALMLAACSGAQPTATSVPPTAEPTDSGISDSELATLAATLSASGAATLAVPDEQETPNAPTAIPIVIDNLYFAQTGGIAGISLTIELHNDGTLIRNGETSRVNPETVQQIAGMLDTVHFFEIPGIFSPGSAADAYRYSLSVNSPNGSRTITSVDGTTPPELYAVYDAIRSLGSSS